MRVKLFTLLAAVWLVQNTSAQNCANCRYLSPVFDSVIVSKNYHFGQGVNADGDTQQLYLDIYEPYGDTVSARPVLIFAFGGGFVQGSKDDWYVVEICKFFSRAGYVCAAIDYRVGIVPLEIITLQYMRIFFRPMQDMKAAVQYMKADYAELGNTHRIDTSRIIIGGASAGGITALMVAHCDKPAELQEMGNLSALDALGGFYSTSGFYPNYSWQTIGTVNIAGALINANWVEPGDMPIISAHGDADMVVPYGSGGLGGINIGGFSLQGSYLVDSIARSKGICSYLFTMEGQDHPNEGMGMQYIYSVTYRIMQRMNALINGNTFCCNLQADITPGDTLFYAPGFPDFTLNAQLVGDNGNAELQWCSFQCNFSGQGNSITFPIDTSLKLVGLTATEGNCQASDLFIAIDSTQLPTAVTTSSSVAILNIYPNPNEGIFTITLPDVFAQEAFLEVLNMEGRVVYQSGISGKQATVQLQGVATGVYTVKVKNGKATGTAKISVK